MKKLLPWLAMSLVAITLIVISAFVLWNFIFKEDSAKSAEAKAAESVKHEAAKKHTAKEIAELTIPMEEITTNLSNNEYIVRMALSFIVEDDKVKEEFTALLPKIRGNVIRILADVAPEELKGAEGLDSLNAKIMNQANSELSEGKVMSVSITDIIVTDT